MGEGYYFWNIHFVVHILPGTFNIFMVNELIINLRICKEFQGQAAHDVNRSLIKILLRSRLFDQFQVELKINWKSILI